MALGLVSENQSEDETTELERKKSLKFLLALRESAKANTKRYMEKFHDAWGYVVGDKRFPAPQNQAAREVEKHLSRTVVNNLFSTIDHNVSVITSANPKVLMKPLQPVPEGVRKRMESILESECNRLDWGGDRLEVAWDGEVGGIGMTMFYVRPNPISGESEICTKTVDPSKFYVNKRGVKFSKGVPSGLSGDVLYAAYEDSVPMSELREMWPDLAENVKPMPARRFGATEETENYVEHTDDEIVELPGGEFIVSKDGKSVVEQEAKVTWGWVSSDEIEAVWEKATNQEPAPGWECQDCGTLYVSDQEGCPDCGSENASAVDVPKDAGAQQLFKKKRYPFGRCLIGIPEQDVLFYDGPNELPLERVFPVAVWNCYRKSRSLYGPGDYHLLKSCSKALDGAVGLLQDHLKKNAHPLFEYTSEAWDQAGTAPGTRVKVEADEYNQSRFISGAAFDYQGWQMLVGFLQRAHEKVSAVDEIAIGGSPAPESGEAQKVRQMARGRRLGGKLDRMNDGYLTDYASIVWELMKKLYTTPRQFIVHGPNNELQAITETVASLPYDVVVEVTADPERIETDRLKGQNLGQFIVSGAIFNPQLLPFMDRLLSGFGVEYGEAQEIQQKLAQIQQQQAQQPEQPKEDPASLIQALANAVRSGLTVSQVQWESALVMAGLPPDMAAAVHAAAASQATLAQQGEPKPTVAEPITAPQPAAAASPQGMEAPVGPG